MKIDQNTLLSMVSQAQMRMDFWKAQSLVGIYYCGPMTVRGLCLGCEGCQVRLKAAFNLRQARKPAALLIYNLRTALTKAQEENQSRPVPLKKDRLGLPVPNPDPFVAIIQQLCDE